MCTFQIKINPSGDYSACVLWFESLITLLMKILTNIPVEFIEHDAYFTPVTFHIRPKIIPPEIPANWQNFQQITKDLYILRAHISQNDDKFLQYPNRNNQDVQMCLVSLAFVSCLPCENWTSAILDLIIKYGDRLYARNYDNVKGLKDYNEVPNGSNDKWIYKIKPEHAAKRFLIADCKIGVRFTEGVLQGKIRETFKIYTSRSSCILLFSGDIRIQDSLTKSIQSLRQRSQNKRNTFSSICICKRYAVAVWHHQDSWFMFEPHACGAQGGLKLGNSGTACCLRSEVNTKFVSTLIQIDFCYFFQDLHLLTSIFIRNVRDYSRQPGYDTSNQFVVFSIVVKVDKVDLSQNVGKTGYVQSGESASVVEDEKVKKKDDSRDARFSDKDDEGEDPR